MALRVLSGRSLVQSVQQAILQMMDEAKLGPQSQIPTERDICERLGVTRHAVRKALEALEAEGKIWRHIGRGTFVGPPPGPNPADPKSVARHTTPREIADARRLLEPQLAAAAAGRATPAQIGDIEDALRRCAASRNMEAYEVADESFHRALAAATGSILLRSLFETVNEARKEIAWGAMRTSILKPERRDAFTAEHERVVHAIRNRDADAAWAAMNAHVETIAEIYEAIDKARTIGHRLISI
jgi:DNA-binding FadR family transcriptional regulator